LLLWIKGALSPEMIRTRLLDPESSFQQKMIAYLDDCHQGHFENSSLSETLDRVRVKSNQKHYLKPTQILPTAPPLDGPVEAKANWWSTMQHETNDILLRANVHNCDSRCKLKGTEKCKSRFPRPITEATHVDETGYVTVRHDEPMLNTINPMMTFLLRCNTDVTSLLTGTSLKAVIAYTTDYITKVGLKTPTMFDLIR
ncbi:hypothetical protein EXIGLDRAFT_586861, partial [Exidia glandulosa HHB12029]